MLRTRRHRSRHHLQHPVSLKRQGGNRDLHAPVGFGNGAERLGVEGDADEAQLGDRRVNPHARILLTELGNGRGNVLPGFGGERLEVDHGVLGQGSSFHAPSPAARSAADLPMRQRWRSGP
jgi:hypothetical protein